VVRRRHATHCSRSRAYSSFMRVRRTTSSWSAVDRSSSSRLHSCNTQHPVQLAVRHSAGDGHDVRSGALTRDAGARSPWGLTSSRLARHPTWRCAPQSQHCTQSATRHVTEGGYTAPHSTLERRREKQRRRRRHGTRKKASTSTQTSTPTASQQGASHNSLTYALRCASRSAYMLSSWRTRHRQHAQAQRHQHTRATSGTQARRRRGAAACTVQRTSAAGGDATPWAAQRSGRGASDASDTAAHRGPTHTRRTCTKRRIFRGSAIAIVENY
jgi:hypothetical protein